MFCLILVFIFVEHYTHWHVLQHAADERIRLEELREKVIDVSFRSGVCSLVNYQVLSGQKRKTTYLDFEQELLCL